jgi:ABC-type transport system, involved in lipoprotein release, permease component
MLLSLSWKNIWRNKTRSLIIIFAIVFGVIGGVGFMAFFNGLIFQRINIAIGNEVSNIQIHNTHFQSNKEIIDTIPNIDEVIRTIDTCKNVKAYSARIKLVAMINSANSNDGIMLNGIDPNNEKKVTDIYKSLKQGDYLPDTRKKGIVIGEKLASRLKVKLRSKVVITMQTVAGNITKDEFKVVGIYHADNSVFEGRNAFVKKDELAPIVGLSSGEAHEIAISLYNDKENEAVVSSIKKKCGSNAITIQSWKEIMPELALFTDVAAYMLYVFMVIIFMALSFGIINTMLMAVLERVREIGMLMAIGMNKTKIFIMIVLETVMLMMTGAVIGLVLSYFIIWFFSVHGIDLSALSKGLSGFGFSTMVYPFLENSAYVKIVIMVVITGFLSSLVPSKRALKLNPSEAIRKL